MAPNPSRWTFSSWAPDTLGARLAAAGFTRVEVRAEPRSLFHAVAI